MIDVAHGVVTDVLELDPNERQQILDLATQRILQRYEISLPILSPNGKFLSTGASITEVASGRVVNSFPGGAGSSAACLAAWRPDGSGYYFIERSFYGLGATGPGPIRLLLTDPAP